MTKSIYPIIILIILIGGFLVWKNFNQFDLPQGTTTILENDIVINEEPIMEKGKVLITDGVKHSIPLNEILSGGPAKDGIPSIDNPRFTSTSEADEYLTADSVGLGLIHKGEIRFYPYQILVWHEIVNDTVAGDPLLVTYCPLCATGIIFDRKINGKIQEFGVSGKLWKSNLLMYNRTGNEDTESLWSQVLGEAVLGVNTGEKLKVISADTVKYGDWKKKNPETKVLSRETGSLRSYGLDPYEGYYTDATVGFGATFSDTRLHPKKFVLGVEVDRKFKAYDKDNLKIGTTIDNFQGKKIRIEKTEIGEVRMFIGENELSYVGGFWFSWLAVHPETELLK